MSKIYKPLINHIMLACKTVIRHDRNIFAICCPVNIRSTSNETELILALIMLLKQTTQCVLCFPLSTQPGNP